MKTFDELFGANQIMIVLRGLGIDEAVAAAHRAWDAGVELLEVPIETPERVPTLAAVVAAGAQRGKVVGAGTVVSVDQVTVASLVGACYTVSPGLDPTVCDASFAADLPHLPGVATPTEVMRAKQVGCLWVKVFPAGSFGPGWVRALRGPFPDVRCLVTGGITPEPKIAAEYLAAGARVVAFGAAITESARHAELVRLMTHTADHLNTVGTHKA